MAPTSRQELLSSVEGALGACPAAREVLVAAFSGAAGLASTIPTATAASSAQQAVVRLRAVLKSEAGVHVAGLSRSLATKFAKEATTANAGSFSRAEFEALVASLTKYAALKARRKNGRRWGLGLTLSAAGASAIAAAVLNTPVLALAAAPAGAAVGLIAVLADGAKVRRGDRRTARAPAGAPTCAAAPAGPQAAAHEPHGSSASGHCSEEELGGAVVQVVALSPAPAPAKAPTKPAPVPDACVSAATAAGGKAGTPAAAPAPAVAAPAAASELPALVRSASPVGASHDLDDVPFVADSPACAADAADASGVAAAPARTSSPGLPPLPLGKVGGAGALKSSASLRKSFKSLKKALSIKDTKAGAKLAGDSQASSEAGSLDVPLSSSRSLRSARLMFSLSSSSKRVSTDGGSPDGDLLVEPSKGSATLKKWGDKLRRSFSNEPPREAPTAA